MFNFGGGMLTGAEIEKQIKKGNIQITPYDPDCINPNSYNLKLHPQLLVYTRNSDRYGILPNMSGMKYAIDDPTDKRDHDIKLIDSDIGKLYDIPAIDSNLIEPIDMMKENPTTEFTIPEEGLVLQPGVLYIGRTVEKTYTEKYIPMINGRSSGGRLGISIHICAGFGDIGFDGSWTLEITCVEPVRIYPNVPIAQVCYFKPHGKIRDLYCGRYHGQEDATASRFYKY